MSNSKTKSQFNKRHPDKKMSHTGRMARSRVHARISLSKSLGKIRKEEDETPIVAIQKVHLYRKQKEFLTKQAYVFERKAEAVKAQVEEMKKKIKEQKELALKLVDGLEKEKERDEEVQVLNNHRRAKPTKTSNHRSKKSIRIKF